MAKLEAISIAATQEHALELTLKEMKAEWTNVEFSTENYRETALKILTSTQDIEIHLDDHLIKTQTMRGSPYFKAFEAEVCKWETQLGLIHTILGLCNHVQKHWLYLEPIFTTDDIILQMPSEGKMFKDIDASWRSVLELVEQNPSVLVVTGSPNILNMLNNSKSTIEKIKVGLDRYLVGARLAFPRLFFLSKAKVLVMLSETRDPTRVQQFIRHCFSGIHSLEFDDLHEAQAMMSAKGERIPFANPLRTRGREGPCGKVDGPSGGVHEDFDDRHHRRLFRRLDQRKQDRVVTRMAMSKHTCC